MASAVLLLLPAAMLLADDAIKGDKGLEGEWKPISAVRDGKESPPLPDGSLATFKADEIMMKTGDRDYTVSIKVDAGKTPKTIDLTPADGPKKGETIKGIYEIKGDELHVCTAEPGKDRPTEFSSKQGSNWSLMTLKRLKK
jgi:uncharacterized protein (TIGR03067 family)